MLDANFFRDDPTNVRERLASMDGHERHTGDWYVFETISADGSLAVGIWQGPPDPSRVMIVYEKLTQRSATLAAQGLVDWYRERGRTVGDAI